MAIPGSSDGQEVLRRGAITGQSTSWTSFTFTGGSPSTGTNSYTVPANHIVTMLSIIWCEAAGNAESISLNQNDTTYILTLQALAANATFIWEERHMLKGGEKLQTLSTSGDVDVLYSYLDQDWS